MIVVVIAHEILHRIVRKELFELAVELCRKCLVVAHYQCRTVQLRNNVSYGERLARAGDAEQYLSPLASVDAVYQLLYGFWLVAHRRKVRSQFKVHGLLRC